ncbi:hypothetical protein L226DRAFT_544981 [Lentinus tigrinus ALCF2SS1-7]|uniref:Helitron helicase-like domain-containing protein n=1 Tax=Lentinus tigrinus ALCF2SS1-6 TaxID=1328759 RepID=A0A5C2SKN0_9APHY|nr:hypothetical protein L227DRAFT_584141 [Lentinus tigrinus ALCF2SS1-6]RPD76615.1 hypothetical protein L226DRAFT_544981 [Lentinus tigrinus ALCF2SS1-7]
MITHFLHVILRYGKPEKGLFGKCTAYYGTVEAQGRGTLHCHLLIWIHGHPSPQKMREMMITSDEYRSHMFTWLESLIKSELLGTSDVVPEPIGHALRRPQHRETPTNIHPGVRPPPRITDMLPSEFQEQYASFVNELVQQYNWHEHTDTCWKYLRRNQRPSDSNCRMRMDGTTRPTTTLDPETLSIQLRRLHPRIANYNDLIIFLIQANMDIKHVGSGEGAKALIYYVTDYITKSALPTHLGLAALMYAISSTKAKYGHIPDWGPQQDTGALTILVNSMLARQEISHQQVMSYLVGGGDHYTSHRYRLLYYASFHRLVRTYWDLQSLTTTRASRPAQPADATTSSHFPTSSPQPANDNTSPDAVPDDDWETVTLSLGSGSISTLNQQQDYLLRPSTEPFASMSLYEFVGLTEKITTSSDTRRLRNSLSNENSPAPLHLVNSCHTRPSHSPQRSVRRRT